MLDREIKHMKYVAYTDGASEKNGSASSAGGYGVVIIRPDHSEQQLRNDRALIGVTSNEMELLAVIKALQFIDVECPTAEIEIRTDSQNVIGWCSMGWKRKAPNLVPYLRTIDELMLKHKVTFTKVKGHSGDHYNNLADRLSTACYA